MPASRFAWSISTGGMGSKIYTSSTYCAGNGVRLCSGTTTRVERSSCCTSWSGVSTTQLVPSISFMGTLWCQVKSASFGYRTKTCFCSMSSV